MPNIAPAIQLWKKAHQMLENQDLNGYFDASKDLHDYMRTHYTVTLDGKSEIDQSALFDALKDETISPTAASVLTQLHESLNFYGMQAVTKSDPDNIEISFISTIKLLSSFFMDCKLKKNDRMEDNESIILDRIKTLISIMNYIKKVASDSIINGYLTRDLMTAKIDKLHQLEQEYSNLDREKQDEALEEIFTYKEVPSKKVAIVDIDGCLVQNGKLNQPLVDRLRNGNYDEIILFTQRSMRVQRQNLGIQLGETTDDLRTSILTIKQAVTALSTALGNKTIKVSTSVDTVFGKPTQYFETGQLRLYEAKYVDNYYTRMAGKEPIDQNNELQKLLDAEEKKVLDEYGKYPQDKVQQFLDLDNELSSNGSDIQYDCYDDNYHNLNELIQHESITNKPNCFVVTSGTIQPVATFKNDLHTLEQISIICTNFKSIYLQKIQKNIPKIKIEDIPNINLKKTNYSEDTKIAIENYKNLISIEEELQSNRHPNPKNHLSAVRDILVKKDMIKQIKSTLGDYAYASWGEQQRMHKFEATINPNNTVLKSKLKDLKGDALKTLILLDFKNEIGLCNSLEDIKKYVKEYKKSYEYEILQTGQGSFTRFAHNLGLIQLSKQIRSRHLKKL